MRLMGIKTDDSNLVMCTGLYGIARIERDRAYKLERVNWVAIDLSLFLEIELDHTGSSSSIIRTHINYGNRFASVL